LASLLMLAGLWAWLDPRAVIAEVSTLAPGWALLALALTLPQLLLCAWRWRLTSRLLGLSLGWRRALREYYLALFLNQLLPGGVAGDAARAWRHSRASGRRGGAWRAVIIERASGQVAVVLLSLLALAVSPLWHSMLGEALGLFASPDLVVAAALSLVLLTLLLIRLARRPPPALAGLGSDLRRSLLAASVWPRQLGGSLLVVLSYALVFVCAARAIGVELPVATLLALAPPVLMAMLIPLSVAGWGIREGAAALVWGLVGLPPAQGVAVSMAYGVLVLLASLPGALWLPGLRGPVTGDGGSDAPGGSGPGERQVEEGIVPAAEGARGRAQRLVQGGDGRHGQGRATRANQQGSHQQMQPVQDPRLEKARYGDPAPLDKHTPKALFGQSVEHGGGGEASGHHREAQAGDMAGGRAGKVDVIADQVEGRRPAIVEQPEMGRHPAAGIEDHPHRLATRHMAHRKQGVILAGGARADHHRLHQGPEPVQVCAALEAVDVVGVPALGGDTPIQALAELGDGQPTLMAGDGTQAVEQVTGLVVHRLAVEGPGQERLEVLAGPAEGTPGRAGVQGLGRGRTHGLSGSNRAFHHGQSTAPTQGVQGDRHASG
jgi:uncharacterized membrane protein YbhN (UPF0104 family)